MEKIIKLREGEYLYRGVNLIDEYLLGRQKAKGIFRSRYALPYMSYGQVYKSLEDAIKHIDELIHLDIGLKINLELDAQIFDDDQLIELASKHKNLNLWEMKPLRKQESK